MSDCPSDIAPLSDFLLQVPSQRVAKVVTLYERLIKRQQAQLPSDRLLAQLQGLLQQASVQQRALDWHIAYPKELPVSEQRGIILEALAASRCLVLTGETGSGKTTQLPKMLVEAGYGRRGCIAVTQPRRLAALSVAQRLREECRVSDASLTHAVRFDDRRSSETRLLVQTDGLLLAEAARDPWLSRYDCILIDEAHERSCTIDVLIALIMRLRQRRPDLALILTSATIDGERFAQHLAIDGRPAPLIKVCGRLYPVERRYRAPADEDLGYLQGLIACVREVHAEQAAGDILCFLPTERDILEAQRQLQDLPQATLLPCFGRLTPSQQQRIFSSVSGRKIVLATPIAETSLTIPGIRIVIDSGLARLKRYYPQSRIERLPVEAVSQASLQQRAGRAGRLGPGLAIGLFSASDAAARPAFTEPEIRRSNLAGVLLHLLACGHPEPDQLPWLDPPDRADWQQAWRHLDELGAINQRRQISQLGQRMARLPLDPSLARICIAGVDLEVAQETAIIAAFLSIQDPRLRPPGEEAQADAAQRIFAHEAGDIASLLNLWHAWKACQSGSARSRFARQHFLSWRRMREWDDVRRQIWQQLGEGFDRPLPGRSHSPGHWPLDAIHQALVAGMIAQVIKYDGQQRSYRCAGQRQVWVHPSSVLRLTRQKSSGARRAPWPAWLVACEIIDTARVWARICAPIEVDWIIEYAGAGLRRSHSEPFWDPQAGRVVVEERLSWLGLELFEKKGIAAEKIVGRSVAESVFIHQALVTQNIDPCPKVLQLNAQAIEQANYLVHRLRDRSLEQDSDKIAQIYERALGKLKRGSQPRPLTSLAALRRLWREQGEQALRISPQDCSALWHQAEREFPLEARLHSTCCYPLSYRYQPGAEDDGVSIHIPLDELDRIETWRIERCVPGLLRIQCLHWIGRLKKEQQRWIGDPERASIDCALALLESSQPLPLALAAFLQQRLGIDPPRLCWQDLPCSARLRIVLHDAAGKVLRASRDLDILGAGLPNDDPLAALRQRWQTEPGSEWPGEIPQDCGEGILKAYPMLLRCRNERAGVAVQRSICASPQAAAAWHQDGLEAFLEASHDQLLCDLAQRHGKDLGKIAGSPAAAVLRAAATAILYECCDSDCRSQAAAERMCAQAQAHLLSQERQLVEWLRQVHGSMQILQRQLKEGSRSLTSLGQQGQRQDFYTCFASPGWQQHLPWWGLQLLPDWMHCVCSQKAPFPPRAQRVLNDWMDCERHLRLQEARACGMAERWREAKAMAGECLCAICRKSAPRAGASELALRNRIRSLEECLRSYHQAWEEAAQSLRDLEPALLRQSGPFTQHLLEQVRSTLKSGLDTSIGADLAAQPGSLIALAQHIRRYLSA